MINIIFIALLIVFCITDIKSRVIHNFIVIPAIVACAYFTKEWPATLIMLAIGAALFSHKVICPTCRTVIEQVNSPIPFWGGGDVKMIMLCGACLGIKAFAIVPLAVLIVFMYRKVKDYRRPLPFAPFLLASCLLTQATILAGKVFLAKTA